MHHFTVFGTAPNLLLVLTIVFSFFFEDFNGVVLSVLFGLLLDICIGPAAGISALIFLCIGMGLQFVRIGIYRDNKIILLFFTAVCTALYYAGYWLIAILLLESDISFIYAMIKVPVSIVFNYIILLIVCHFARKADGFTV
jgi:rod shape-determining protein MreD